MTIREFIIYKEKVEVIVYLFIILLVEVNRVGVYTLRIITS